MRIVLALGGNALLARGQPLEAHLQTSNVATAAEPLATVARRHNVVLTHGNGPQVGLLALQAEAYTDVAAYPLDILDAESQGMIGYLLAQALRNELPGAHIVTLLTQIVVDPSDDAFDHPTKPIGPVLSEDEAKRVASERGWMVARDGDWWRRVVPSPQPLKILELPTIRSLVDSGVVVICGGGGGIPVMQRGDRIEGVEAVIDKDLSSALLATELGADMLVMLTDVPGIAVSFGKPDERWIRSLGAEELGKIELPAGSMGPKAAAAQRFVQATGGIAAIGNLADAPDIVEGQAGTLVHPSGPILYSDLGRQTAV